MRYFENTDCKAGTQLKREKLQSYGLLIWLKLVRYHETWTFLGLDDLGETFGRIQRDYIKVIIIGYLAD